MFRHSNNLIDLSLSDNNLTGDLDEGICNIKRVWLVDNQLTGILPPCVCDMSTIEVDNNRFCEEYPECLDQEEINSQNTENCTKK